MIWNHYCHLHNCDSAAFVQAQKIRIIFIHIIHGFQKTINTSMLKAIFNSLLQIHILTLVDAED